MWAYDSLDRRAEIRAAALADKDWQALLRQVHPLIDEMDNMLITPWTQSPMQ